MSDLRENDVRPKGESAPSFSQTRQPVWFSVARICVREEGLHRDIELDQIGRILGGIGPFMAPV
jgi:hypothetical protein